MSGRNFAPSRYVMSSGASISLLNESSFEMAVGVAGPNDPLLGRYQEKILNKPKKIRACGCWIVWVTPVKTVSYTGHAVGHDGWTRNRFVVKGTRSKKLWEGPRKSRRLGTCTWSNMYAPWSLRCVNGYLHSTSFCTLTMLVVIHVMMLQITKPFTVRFTDTKLITHP